MEKKQWKISIDLQELTVNSEHIPGMYRWHVCVRNTEGRLLLKEEDIPVQEGDVKWVKFSALHPNPENGFHEGNFVASAIAVNEEGSTIAENDSEAFFLTEGQIQFIKDTYAASHPKVPSGEQPVTPTVTVVSETAAIEPERPPGGDLGIHIPQPVASPLPPRAKDEEGGVSGETDEAQNIQASPEIPPAHTDTGSEEKNLTDATPATEAQATDQAPTPPATPSPEQVTAYALEQMQKQLAEKEKRHVEELARVHQKTAEDMERLRQEHNENTERLRRERAEHDRQQAETLRRANEQAERKLEEERAAHQRVEREQRQRQEQEQVTNAARQRLQEEQMANLKQQVAALVSAQQAQAANPAPAAAAPETPTTPPHTHEATADTTTTGNDGESEQVRHSGRFVWGASHSLTLAIILLAIVAAALILWNNSVPSSEKLADTGDKAELIRLQEEMNRTKTTTVAGSHKSATPIVPTPVTLETEGKTLDNKDVDPSLSPSSIRNGAQAQISMLNNSSFGDNAWIEVNNKIDIHDNRQDNRQTIVHPNGWPLDWKPTLPTVVVSDIRCGIRDIILPPRGVQCFELAQGWCVEVAREDMPLIDAKYGNDDHCFDYTLGKPGNRLSGNQVRIRPKAHQYEDVTVTVSIKHADCTHPPGPHR